MRMILNAPAVAKLIELDPDGTVELAKNAAYQVAQQIAKRIKQEEIYKFMDNVFHDEVMGGAWHRRVTVKYQEVIVGLVRALAAKFVHDLTSGQINSLIEKRVDEIFKSKREELDRALEYRIDQLLRERFAAMFGR